MPPVTGHKRARPALLVVIYHNPDYYPPTVNAIEIMRRCFRVCVVCRNLKPPMRHWPSDVEIRRVGLFGSESTRTRASALAKVREYRRFVAAVRDAIEELKPSLIYAYEPLGFAAANYASARRESIPTLYHLHEMPDEGFAGGMLQGWLSRYALSRTHEAAAVIFPEATRARIYLQRAHDSRAAFTVPNFPARDFAADLTARELSLLAAQRLSSREMLYMGSLGDAHANLESVAALASFDGRLTLIGSAKTDFVGQIRGLARLLKVSDRLELTGPMLHHELPQRARTAALGLALHKPLSSNLEYSVSATNKLFEYAACGLPAIVADLPNYREFLRSERWVAYADPFDSESIAAAARTLLSNPQTYQTMSLAARRAFENRFNYETAFAPLMCLILALTSGEPSDVDVISA